MTATTTRAEPGRVPRRAALLAHTIGGLGGLAWFVWAVGVERLRLNSLDGLDNPDTAAHVIGWLFFRNEAWTLPLGALPSLVHPVGTTLGFTDSNPLLAVLLKPLSGWLPSDFQYIGPWLALCFVLQGVFGARIALCFTPRASHATLAGLIFVLAPPMLFRIAHETLTAHWLLLAAIWVHLDTTLTRTWRLAWLAGLLLVAAAVHPTLAAMVATLGLALVVQLCARGDLRPAAAVATAALLVLQALATFALLGYFGGADITGGGFGIYSADLLTLVNGYDYSRWWPAFPFNDGQYEGFAFLGSGVLLLALAGPVLGRWRRDAAGAAPAPPRRLLASRWTALTTAAGLMGLFALSQFVTAGGVTILTMRGVYEPVMDLIAPFRSSGRFIWPLHYVAVSAIVAVVVQAAVQRARIGTALLLMALAIQAAEVTRTHRPAGRPLTPWPRVTAAAWQTLTGGYRHLTVYPPWYVVETEDCRPNRRPYSDIVALADFAYRHRLTLNSGYLARYDFPALSAHCRELTRVIGEARPADDTIYVVDGETARALGAPGSPFTCADLRPHHVCIARTSAAGGLAPWRGQTTDRKAASLAGPQSPGRQASRRP